MGLGDIYELTLKSAAGGADLYNVFYYRQASVAVVSTETTSEYIVNEFQNTTLEAILQILSREAVVRNLSCRNLFVVPDSYSRDVDIRGYQDEGGGNVDTYAPLVAVSYKLRTANRSVKSGGKRFGGLPEFAAIDGEFTHFTYLQKLTALSEALMEPLKVGSVIRDDVFYPVVVKRVREMVNGVAKYRLPALASEAVWSIIVSAVFSPFVSSQVTRKVRLA